MTTPMGTLPACVDVDEIRGVLGDDTAWAIYVSDPETAAAAADWLTDTVLSIEAQISARQADLDLWLAEEQRPHLEVKRRRAEFLKWRSSALYFKTICNRRKRQLVVRDRDHLQRVTHEREAAKAALAKVQELADTTSCDDECECCDDWKADLAEVLADWRSTWT